MAASGMLPDTGAVKLCGRCGRSKVRRSDGKGWRCHLCERERKRKPTAEQRQDKRERAARAFAEHGCTCVAPVCPKCGALKDKHTHGLGWTCTPCDRGRKARYDKARTREQRQAENQRTAERKGKSYTPGVPYWRASADARRSNDPAAIERRARALEQRNARQAWQWWISHAPQWWREAREHLLSAHHRANVLARDWERRALVEAAGYVSKQAIAAELRRSSCPYCGCELDGSAVALDHINPVALGGQHVEANILGTCRRCNARKGAKPFAVWLGQLAEPYRSRCRKLYRQRFGDERQGVLL